MASQLPLFPLELVVFPGERLPLHIFEMRYRQLVGDCLREGLSFGIPTFINNALGFGTEMKIVKVSRHFSSGEMDIICEGLRVFRIAAFFNPYPGRLYAGGEVIWLNNTDDGTLALKERIIELLYRFYTHLAISFDPIDVDSFYSFNFGHKIGLNMEQEYRLLQMEHERERLEFIKAHLENINPILRQVNKTKELIMMNGHFRNFDPLDFKDYTF